MVVAWGCVYFALPAPAEDQGDSVNSKITIRADATGIPLRPLSGVIVDDHTALTLGRWQMQRRLDGYVGDGYRVTKDPQAEISYLLQSPAEGRYELRMIYAADSRYSPNAAVEVTYRQRRTTRLVSQQKRPTEGYYKTIGRFDLQSGESIEATVRGRRDGWVHADAMQLIEVDDSPEPTLPSGLRAGDPATMVE